MSVEDEASLYFRLEHVKKELDEHRRLIESLEEEEKELERKTRRYRTTPSELILLDFRIYGYTSRLDTGISTMILEHVQLACGNVPVGIADRVYLFKPVLEAVNAKT